MKLTQEIIALQEVMMEMQDKHIAFLKGTLSKIDEIEHSLSSILSELEELI